MTMLLTRMRGWIFALIATRARPRAEEDEALCDELAAHLAEMGPHAAGSTTRVSPGTERLLTKARLIERRQFAGLVPALSDGIVGSSASQLRAGAAGDAVRRSTEHRARTQQHADEHRARRPQVPPVVNRVGGHPAARAVIAALCVTIEMIISAPAFEVLSRGTLILGWFAMHDVLALLLGLITFAAAEVAAECFLTWLQGHGSGRSALQRLGRLTRRAEQPAAGIRPAPTAGGARGRYQHAAGVASVLIAASMIALLGWFISVREDNVRAAALIASGSGSGQAPALPGLPVAPAATAGTAGPIAGLGGPATRAPATVPGAITPGPAPPSAANEGQLGPIGGLSIIAFVLAFIAAALGGATHEYTVWSRASRKLRKEVRAAEKAGEELQRRSAAMASQTPAGSARYDLAARHAVSVADECLQRARNWESRVRELYPVYCRRNGTRPVALAFTPLPPLAAEVERLLSPILPDGRQAGGYGFGTSAPTDAITPAAGTLGVAADGASTAEPHDSPSGAAHGDDVNAAPPASEEHAPPPTQAPAGPGRPGADDVLGSLADAIGRMRTASTGDRLAIGPRLRPRRRRRPRPMSDSPPPPVSTPPPTKDTR